jgi:HK97 family phage major capsid protein
MENENSGGDVTDNKGKMTRDDLATLIRESVQGVVEEKVSKAVQPLRETRGSLSDALLNTTPPRSNSPEKKGIGAARFVRAMAFGRGDPERAKHFAQRAWNDDMGDYIQKALAAGDFTAGGFMVPPEFAQDIIELLRNRTVVRAAGARVLPMPRGTMHLPKQTAGATVGYVGENRDIGVTEPIGGEIVMTAKKLAAIVPISNDLLMYDIGDQADEYVREDLVQQMAIREDQAFLRDDGMADTPKGLRHWVLPAGVQASNGTTAANIEDDCKDLINHLESANVRMINPVWFMSPRSKNHLINLRDASSGELIFPEMRTASMMLYGHPVFLTNSIPNNLGGGTETEFYLVDMADAIIGESGGLEIAVDGSASYTSGGSTVSAFQQDQTLMRVISRHDFAMRHEESIALKSDVTWGA